jgi:hypothetical protein
VTAASGITSPRAVVRRGERRIVGPDIPSGVPHFTGVRVQDGGVLCFPQGPAGAPSCHSFPACAWPSCHIGFDCHWRPVSAACLLLDLQGVLQPLAPNPRSFRLICFDMAVHLTSFVVQRFYIGFLMNIATWLLTEHLAPDTS